MLVLGSARFLLGGFIALAGDVMFLDVAHKRGAWWWLGCRFLPPVWLTFALLNPKAAAKPTLIDPVRRTPSSNRNQDGETSAKRGEIACQARVEIAAFSKVKPPETLL